MSEETVVASIETSESVEELPEDKSSTKSPSPEKLDPNTVVTVELLNKVIAALCADIGAVNRGLTHAGECIERLAQLKAEDMAAIWDASRDKKLILPEHLLEAKRIEIIKKTLTFIFKGDMNAMNDVLKTLDEAIEKKEANASASKIIIAGR